MRTYWRQWGFWQWWWVERVSGEAKLALAVTLAITMGLAGWLAATKLTASEPAAATFVTTRVLTIADKNGAPKIVTQLDTVTQSAKTKFVTVHRGGKTVVIRAPGETETVSGPVREHVVTNRRTDTVVRTQTAEHLATVTAPGTTNTVTTEVTTEVTQPQRTVTDTSTVTVTNPATVTSTVTNTVTDTTTETVTETKPRPN